MESQLTWHRPLSSLFLLLSLLSLNVLFSSSAIAQPLRIVAAENFYGTVAQELGGPYVTVTSILNSPSQDPHFFSASPSVAKAIATADIVIYNGAAYDPWAQRLLTASRHQPDKIIIVAQLIGKQIGDNPHIWYDPNTLPIFAKQLTVTLSQQDPAHQNYYQQQLQRFTQNYQPLLAKIAALKHDYPRAPLIATEPLFNDMAQALGFIMFSQDFQLNIMNDAPPTPTQIRAFENALRNHTVRILIYNDQVSNPITQRMQNIAQTVRIPTVGMAEMQPADKTYITWMLDQLNKLQQALADSR